MCYARGCSLFPSFFCTISVTIYICIYIYTMLLYYIAPLWGRTKNLGNLSKIIKRILYRRAYTNRDKTAGVIFVVEDSIASAVRCRPFLPPSVHMDHCRSDVYLRCVEKTCICIILADVRCPFFCTVARALSSSSSFPSGRRPSPYYYYSGN